jgi:hypothetical protein
MSPEFLELPVSGADGGVIDGAPEHEGDDSGENSEDDDDDEDFDERERSPEWSRHETNPLRLRPAHISLYTP